MKPTLSLFLLACLTAPLTSQGSFTAVNFAGDVFEVDPSTAAETFIGPSGWTDLNCMAKGLDGCFYSMSGGTVIRIDRNTGIGINVVSTSLTDVRGAAIDDLGVFFAVQDGGPGLPDQLYSIDLTSGTTTYIGSINYVLVEALDDVGGVLYGWDCSAGLITIDKINGGGTGIGASGGTCNNVRGLGGGFAPGSLYGANMDMSTVNTGTGALTFIGGPLSDLRGLEFCIFTLDIIGSCPGLADVVICCASANNVVAVVLSPFLGPWTVTGGACAGLILGIGPPVNVTMLNTDDCGKARLQVYIPPGACGMYVQAVDAATCGLSNIVGPL
ncbi:MAG: hypothetical protein DWQ01_03710 [Planctomycetota bacterium]|nr:MAG: hypothetical protein DWQ01_03710 [Planctomycetota bacterium]